MNRYENLEEASKFESKRDTLPLILSDKLDEIPSRAIVYFFSITQSCNRIVNVFF